MLKTELKAILAVVGTMIPFAAQADMNTSNSNQTKQAPAYVAGEPVKTGQLPAGYNASAAYQCENGWDIFITGDYIYWNWNQDSLKVAESIPVAAATSGGTQESLYLNPGYTSGFQVGLGFNMPGMDNWNLYSEYTWYRNTGSRTFTNDGSHVFTRANLPEDVGTYFYSGTIAAKDRMHFDALDFLVKRPFYNGRKLTVNFGTGLTALWISQKATITTSGVRGTTVVPATAISTTTTQKQTSWGLGPKFGLETNWMLGWGFGVMANLSTSVIYNQYEVHTNSSGTVGTTAYSLAATELDGFSTLRPITQAFLGMGWNMGFCDDEFRFGISAGYDFDVYWNYNMRGFSRTGSAGNMYLQGLNVGARFDF